MIYKKLIGIVLGAIAGAVIGYLGQCAGGG